MHKCCICGKIIFNLDNGEPYISFNGKEICSNCYISLIPKIYRMAGCGDGGLIHICFDECLHSSHNRSKRSQIKNYRSIFKKLMIKYKFQCVHCNCKENLTIDHIIPVSKGGKDDIENLQILCKSCNSKKGVKEWPDIHGSECITR